MQDPGLSLQLLCSRLPCHRLPHVFHTVLQVLFQEYNGPVKWLANRPLKWLATRPVKWLATLLSFEPLQDTLSICLVQMCAEEEC